MLCMLHCQLLIFLYQTKKQVGALIREPIRSGVYIEPSKLIEAGIRTAKFTTINNNINLRTLEVSALFLLYIFNNRMAIGIENIANTMPIKQESSTISILVNVSAMEANRP